MFYVQYDEDGSIQSTITNFAVNATPPVEGNLLILDDWVDVSNKKVDVVNKVLIDSN